MACATSLSAPWYIGPLGPILRGNNIVTGHAVTESFLLLISARLSESYSLTSFHDTYHRGSSQVQTKFLRPSQILEQINHHSGCVVYQFGHCERPSFETTCGHDVLTICLGERAGGVVPFEMISFVF